MPSAITHLLALAVAVSDEDDGLHAAACKQGMRDKAVRGQYGHSERNKSTRTYITSVSEGDPWEKSPSHGIIHGHTQRPWEQPKQQVHTRKGNDLQCLTSMSVSCDWQGRATHTRYTLHGQGRRSYMRKSEETCARRILRAIRARRMLQ
eukprot:8761806-Prorocentrum_lima.AAC.1